MTKEVGLWIDHRKAVIVALEGGNVETQEILSNMEKHLQYSGAAPQDIPEDMVDRQYAGHLRKYYDSVVLSMKDAVSIFIMGPGEAKGEFHKRLESENLGDRVVGVETVDKLTDRQIAAKVRQYYTGVG